MSEGVALDDLLGDADARWFAEEVWSRSAWSRKAGEGPDLVGLLTLDDVDELLSVRGLRTPFLRVAKDGKVLDPARYTRGGGVGARVRDQVDADQVVGLLSDGCTVVLQGLHRAWAPLRAFADVLGRELGHPVQVNAYLTPEGAQGFEPHYDTHDVFVVQTAGTKEWRVHAPVVADPRPDDEWTRRRDEVRAAAAEEPVIARTLEPGDVVYLPRGWIHAARANAGLSLHLTFGIHPYTRRDLADLLVEAALGDSPLGRDPLDASLPLGFDPSDPQQLDPALASVRADVLARLAGVGPASLSTASSAAGRRTADRTRCGRSASCSRLTTSDPQGTRRATRCSGRAPGSGSAGDGHRRGHARRRRPSRSRSRPPMRAPCASSRPGRPSGAEELVGLDADARRRLVRDLLLAGVLVVTSASA